MSSHASVSKNKRRRFAPIALATGIAGAVLLSLSLTGTMSGFVASITNSTNTAASGALVMQEQNAAGAITCLSTDGGTVSTNAATCATINKFGGSTTMTPGNTVTTPITIKNVGTVTASTFTLKASAACAQVNNPATTLNGNATDLCAKLNVVITSGATTVFSGTAAALGNQTTPATFTLPTTTVAPNTTVPFTFAVTLDSSAGNAYQGLQASVPLIWTFGA